MAGREWIFINLCVCVLCVCAVAPTLDSHCFFISSPISFLTSAFRRWLVLLHQSFFWLLLGFTQWVVPAVAQEEQEHKITVLIPLAVWFQVICVSWLKMLAPTKTRILFDFVPVFIGSFPRFLRVSSVVGEAVKLMTLIISKIHW